MEEPIISRTGEWDCPRCGAKAQGYRCGQCRFRIYAGFWIRLFSQLIDMAIIYSFSLFFCRLEFLSYHWFLATNLISFIFFRFYFVYLVGKFGQTPGKMLLKARVIRIDGTPLRWSNAWVRNSVETSIVVLLNAAFVMAFSHFSPNEFNALDIAGKKNLLNEFMPGFVGTMLMVNKVFGWSESLVVLTNRKKRALHDFLAGTVVIHDPRLPYWPRSSPKRKP